MVLWPGTQRTREKEEAEGKNRVIFHQVYPLGLEEVCSLGAALAAVCPQGQAGATAPPQSWCSQLWCNSRAAAEGEGGCSQGPVSVGGGRDIKIPPALLALLEIEL